MKKFLLGSVALAALGIGAPAIAADMAVRPVAAAPAFSWTGCHLGGLVGFEWGNHDGYNTGGASTFLAPGRATNGLPILAGQPVFDSYDTSGLNGGGYAGCDYQFGSIVVGVEGDWSSVNKSGQANATPNWQSGVGPGLATTNPAVKITNTQTGGIIFAEAQERWYATARGRLGYAVDKWLFFVSGGAAWSKVDESQFSPTTPATGYFALDNNHRLHGWTVGAGVDYAPPVLKGHWIVRAEYLYVRFRDYTAFTAPIIPLNGTGYVTGLDTRLDNHVVRFGLSYKFL
jgi:outer membrane immunogenic protein